jgi:putative NADPH-quinone reductase
MGRRIVAIIGSYRKGGAIDSAVEAVLEGARQKGAETETIHLIDRQIEFCTNCRQCTQAPGEERVKCVQKDDLEAILAEVEAADGVVLGSPVNYWNTTAVFRRFLERLIGYIYWPWGQPGPKQRTRRMPRKAVLVASSAMPGFLIPLATGAPRALRIAAQSMGAKTVGKLWIGLVGQQPKPQLSAGVLKRARKMGKRLA